METKKAKVKTSPVRKWLRRVLITLAVIILLPIGLFTLGWLNRDTIINELQDWYSENHTGTLTIGEVNASFLGGFPNVGFTLKDISQTNMDSIADRFSSLTIEEAKLTIAAGNLLRGNIQFEKIAIKNVTIASEVQSSRSFSYHEQLLLKEIKQQKKGFQLPVWLNPKGVEFSLENVVYVDKDTILSKYFNLEVHQIKGAYSGDGQNLKGIVSLDITAHNVGFNTKKGTFSNGARVTGDTKFNVDLNKNSINILEFPLHIDQQTFQISGLFDLSSADSYAFQLKNDATDFNATKRLLTDSLASKVKHYDIKKPFKSQVNLNGTFAYGNDPDVTVKFSTTNNEVAIYKDYKFKNVDFNGFLTTDIYTTDSLRLAKKTGKDVKIAFDSITADLEGIDVQLRNAYYQSTPEISNLVVADVLLKGSNENLAKVIQTDNFDFKGGNFKLDVAINGDIPDVFQFLNTATGSFSSDNTQISLKKNGLQLPIQAIDLTFNRENSTLRQLIVNLPNGENLVFKGQLKNISGILSKTQTSPTTSQIYLNADNLNINDVLSLAKSFVPATTARDENRKALHETLEAVYSQFHPQFNINLEALTYNDVTITHLKSKIELINSNTILLRNFDFKYDEALTSLNGRVVVPGPESQLKDAIYMDAEATSSGPITVFRDLFNIELFRIDAGEFAFNGNVNGNIKEFSELMNNAVGDLTLRDTKLYYEPADMDFGIDSLELFVNKGDILLDKFNLEIGNLYPINLSGLIRKFPGFLLDTKESNGSIKLKIAAPYLDGDDLLSTINSFKTDDTLKIRKDKKALHSLFKDINKFNPEITLEIDTLKYSDLTTEKIQAKLYFENDSILKLEHFDLAYKNTTVNVQGNMNAHTGFYDIHHDNPFDIDFTVRVEGKSEDLNDYLKTTNFIFQSGDFEFNGRYEAQSEDLILLSAKTFGDLKISQTLVDFKAAGLLIPVDSLHVEIDNDLATLKTLDINLPGKSSIAFAGSIDHFSDFIAPSGDSKLRSSNFSIYSPYLDSEDIKIFLENIETEKDSTVRKEFDLQKFKDAMTKIDSAFYPTLDIKIDTLHHNKLTLNDFSTNLLYDDLGNFKIKDTQLDFYGGSIKMNVTVGLTTGEITPVVLNMQGSNMNLHELIPRFDYFNNDDLKNTERIEGLLNYTLNATGMVDVDGNLQMETLNGTLDLALEDFELYNYKPIMDNVPLMKDERFKNLRFRPIVQTFEIKDGELIIPRTEIQSSAIQVFVEGRLKFNEYVNVWLSIPWHNLKSNDGLEFPQKTTFKNAGSKFYIQLLQDKTNEKKKKQALKIKFRLGNKKLRAKQ